MHCNSPASRCAPRTSPSPHAALHDAVPCSRGSGALHAGGLSSPPHAQRRRRRAVASVSLQMQAGASPADAARAGTKPCVLYDMHDRQARGAARQATRLTVSLTPALQVPYVRAWGWQKALVRRRLAALDAGECPPDELLLLQHPPVYTLGTGSTPAHLRFDPEHPPFELHRTERGGEATYHGPGQLVLYPILNLKCARLAAATTRRLRPLRPFTRAASQAAPGGSALVHARVGGGQHPRTRVARPVRCASPRRVFPPVAS